MWACGRVGVWALCPVSCVGEVHLLLQDFAEGGNFGETHTFQIKGEEEGERKKNFELLGGTQNGKISFLSAPPAA